MDLELIRKCLILFVLLISPVNTFAKNIEAPYKQIENKQIVGRLWLPNTEGRSPAVLLIGGSGGGYEDQDAAWLSSSGFVVLNVRYFGAKGLPQKLVNIPIEYFDAAITWLENHEQVMKGSIGLFGHSKGSEAAILTAFYNSKVKAVVARSPSSVVWAGPGWAGLNESSWSWGGRPLSFNSVGLLDGALWLYRTVRNKKLIKTRSMFENALENEESLKASMLPIDRVQANLLLLSGKDDQQWPSSKMADMLISKLDEASFEYSYEHVAFENAGHRPGRPSKSTDTFANGGSEKGNIEAHAQTKVLVAEFLNENLR